MAQSSMTRSKSQVLRGYLPGQTFMHQNEIIVKTIGVDADRAYGTNRDLLVENLKRKLARWGGPQAGNGAANRAPGFLDPDRYADDYLLLDPKEVYYKPWPLVLRCTNKSCERVAVFRDEDDWSKARKPAECAECGRKREQMPYLQVHVCGRDNTLNVPSCDRHGGAHVYLKDEGSFETSTWRCRACNGRVLENMRAWPCTCGQGGGFVHRTIRQDDRFLTHLFAFVNFDQQTLRTLSHTPGADQVVVGYYMGLFDDYEQALIDAANEPDAHLAELFRTQMEPMMRAQVEAGKMTEDDIAAARKRMVPGTSEAMERLVRLVPEDIVAAVGTDQRARERTLIFAAADGYSAPGLKTHRLADFEAEARDTGRHGAARVLADTQRRVRELGFTDVLVVENFPVTLAAYGFSRLGRSPESVLLRPFYAKRGRNTENDKLAIYTGNTNTEAVFFELDAVRVLDWLVDNRVMGRTQLSADPGQALVAAKAAILVGCHRDPAVAQWVELLQHTLAHALIRNLGERSGFAENTMAEYLMVTDENDGSPHPNGMLSFGLFADTHQEYTLGALVSLVEHKLGEWLNATVSEAARCDWDPQCGHDDGACMGCLHLSFGCDHFNERLDRAVLFGAPAGHKLDVRRGYWQ
jgi:hypothetical protein